MLNRFIETLKKLRRGSNHIKICPHCRSPYLTPATNLDGWLIPLNYYCKKCGYAGPLIIEVTDKTHLSLEPQ